MPLTLGLVGKPNVGKSTFFSAATAAKAEMANYPFTTIDANRGVTFVAFRCPHTELKVQCAPQNSECRDGTRWVPIELVDVAGLVEGAHEGKGLGNKFLDDLRQAAALIHVVDASGATDAEGNPVDPGTHDPAADVAMLEAEIDHWIAGILADGWERKSKTAHQRGDKAERVLADRLAGLRVKELHAKEALRGLGLPERLPDWGAAELLRVAEAIRKQSKPFLIAANKADIAGKDRAQALGAKAGGAIVVPTSAEAELALKNAAKADVIRYTPGEGTFEVVAPDKLSATQTKALDYIRHHVLDPFGSTGVAECVTRAAKELLGLIAVYPVEDEHHYTDKKGNILPDAHLVPRGTTAREMAYRIHTDLGERFIRAIDARSHRAIAADHELEDGAVVRIVADA